MIRFILKLAAVAAATASPAAMAQNAPSIAIPDNPNPSSQRQLSPADAMSGGAGGAGAFSGYVPSANPGLYVAGSGAVPLPSQAISGNMPKLSDGRRVSAEKIEGFNEVIEQNFPLTPDMARRYRDIYEENQRALKERDEPDAKVGAVFVSLEPGEAPADISVAPGIASVIHLYDATGEPWPITQLVLGSGEDFQVVQLGENSNNFAITPLVRFGWSNIIVTLADQPRPVVMRIRVSETEADFSKMVQVMAPGPNARQNTAADDEVVREAGSSLLLAALSGVDMPDSARKVAVGGVNARGWLVGKNLYLRSKHALLSPSWTASMSGPDGVRVYEIPSSSVALFSVDGQVVRADITLP